MLQLYSTQTSHLATYLLRLILDTSLHSSKLSTIILFSMQTILLTITLAVLQVVNATPTLQESEVPAGLKIIDQYQSQNGNGTITW
jgi:hypothetical protein